MDKQSVVSRAAPRSASTDATSVRSIVRAGQIVTTLAEHPYPMGIVELADRIQLSPGSVHRILMTLLRIGWVEQNARTAKYRLGTRLLGIGATGLIANPVIEAGKTYLARLAEMSEHDALLSTVVGMRTVHLARAAGTSTRMIAFEPGRSQPAHAMADGKLLLAHLPSEELDALLAIEGPLQTYTSQTITDPDALRQEFETIRAQGYAIDDRERFETGRGVAVPVLGVDGEPILAMGCVGEFELTPQFRTSLVNQMLSLARELSNQLAAVGDIPG